MKSKIILTLIASGLIVAPILKADPPIVVQPGTGSTTTTTTTTVDTPGVWTTVPDDYEGETFIIGNQYYHGGKYEKGDFTWEGRHYTDRYFHDGKWLTTAESGNTMPARPLSMLEKAERARDK